MKQLLIKSLTLLTFSTLLLSCGGETEDLHLPVQQSEGVRLKYFSSVQDMGNELGSFLKPGFELTSGSEIKEFGNYQRGVGGYEYSSTWKQITPLDPKGEFEEWVNINGVPEGWDRNKEHEATTKAELLERHKEYEEVFDARLAEAPYKDHIIVLKNKANKKGEWKFLAYIDPTHRVDGDGQRVEFSGGFSPVDSADKAKYEVPSDTIVASIFIELVEPVKK